jgi:polysaccharide pyruvyl transferase WcaK-like protein
MTGKDIKIGLLWHSASAGNLGVGALTLGNMAIVRGVCAELGLTPRFTIIGMRDGMDRYVPPEEAPQFVVDSRAVVDPRRAFRTLNAQDCVLDIGSGDSFTDIYGPKRFAFLWSTKMLTILGGTPLLFSPQTIGPFSRQPQSMLAGWAMNRAEAVITRDQPSVEATAKLAPKARCAMATDVAFAMPFQDRGAERGGKTPRVGLNVSGLLLHEATAGTNRFGLEVDYAALSHGLMEGFRAKGVQVCLFTHARGFSADDDDGRAADQFAERYPWAERVPDFPGPMEAKSFLSSLDFVVSARMHACIGSLSSGTPVAPIAYSRKFRGLFDLIGYPWRIEVQGKDTDAALAYILDAFDRRAELAADGQAAMQKVDGYLEVYREALRALFRKVTA